MKTSDENERYNCKNNLEFLMVWAIPSTIQGLLSSSQCFGVQDYAEFI